VVRGNAVSATLLIAAVALSGLHDGLGCFTPVLGQGTTEIVGFLYLALVVASYEAFVASGADQFAFAARHHLALL